MSETRRAVFTLDSGDFIAEFPDGMTEIDAADLTEYLGLLITIIQKIGRRNAVSREPAPSPPSEEPAQ